MGGAHSYLRRSFGEAVIGVVDAEPASTPAIALPPIGDWEKRVGGRHRVAGRPAALSTSPTSTSGRRTAPTSPRRCSSSPSATGPTSSCCRATSRSAPSRSSSRRRAASSTGCRRRWWWCPATTTCRSTASSSARCVPSTLTRSTSHASSSRPGATTSCSSPASTPPRWTLKEARRARRLLRWRTYHAAPRAGKVVSPPSPDAARASARRRCAQRRPGDLPFPKAASTGALRPSAPYLRRDLGGCYPAPRRCSSSTPAPRRAAAAAQRARQEPST